MAQQRLRPGPWRLVEGGTASRVIQIDYEKFDIPQSATVEFEVKKMGLYDDTSLTAYRNPVTTFTPTSNVGSGQLYDPSYEKEKMSK